MAKGSVRIRCSVCRRAKTKEGDCKHKERVFNGIVIGHNGKQISATRASKGEIDKWISKTLTDIGDGTHHKIEPKKLIELALRYLSPFEGNVDPNTFIDYEYYIELIIGALGDYPIAKISGEMVNNFMKQAAGQSFSKRQKMQRHLKGIFLLAEMEDSIVKNVTRYMKPVRNVSQPSSFSGFNIKRIKELLEDTDDTAIRFYYQMAFFTGMRPSELCGLRVSSIDMDKKEIRVEIKCKYIKKTSGRIKSNEAYFFGAVKTNAGARVLPIGRELYENLQIFLINRRENKHNTLFARADGTPICHEIDINKAHYNPQTKRLNKISGFPIMTFYDLTRHIYASMLFEMKPSPGHKKIQYLMGHKDYQTTANIYARLFGKDISEDGEFHSIADNMEIFVSSSK